MIDWSTFPSVVMIQGDSSFLKGQELRKMRKVLSAIPVMEYEASTFSQALRMITTKSLFMKRQVVLILGFDSIPKKEQAKLISYLESPNADVCLILMSVNKKRQLKWTKTLKVIQEDTLNDPSKWELSKWLLEYSSSLGILLPPAYAEAICTNVGTDLYSLANEMHKLRVYLQGRKDVTVSDLEAVLFQHEALSIFEVADLWASKDVEQASLYFLKHMSKTTNQDRTRSLLVLIITLQDRIVALLKAKDLKLEGKTTSQISKSLGMSAYLYTERIVPQLKSRKIDELEEAYLRICFIESRTKLGGPSQMLLEAFILST